MPRAPPLAIATDDALALELCAIASSGDVRALRALLDRDDTLDVNVVVRRGTKVGTPLLDASIAGRADMVRALIAAGARADATHYLAHDNTALMVAAMEHHAGVVAALLERGADANARNDAGESALAYAARANDAPMARMLLDHGADVDARDDKGNTALMYAAEKDGGEGRAMCGLLLSRGANPNASNNFDATALMYAARSGQIDLVTMLLQFGADPTRRCQGKTAVMWASEAGHEDVARALEYEMDEDEWISNARASRRERVRKCMTIIDECVGVLPEGAYVALAEELKHLYEDDEEGEDDEREREREDVQGEPVQGDEHDDA
jgi:ankyrin repeat protein